MTTRRSGVVRRLARGVVLVVAFLVAAIGVMAIAVRSANASITTESATATVAPRSGEYVEPECATGTVPIGAGFAVGGFDTVEGGVLPTASRVYAPVTGAATYGLNLSDTATGRLTGHIYCDSEPRDVKTRWAHIAVPLHTARTVTANCAADRRLISGGFVVAYGDEVVPYRSLKYRNGWRISAYNSDVSPGIYVAAFAVCQAHGPQLKATAESAMTNATQYHGLATVRPTCPAGTKPLSGGFSGHLSASGPPSGVAPLASERVNGGWRVTGWALSATVDAQLTGYAYCASG